MAKVTLPRLAGTREAVADLLEEQNVAVDLEGDSLVVFASELTSGSSSFADELVRESLEERKAQGLALVGPPKLFEERVFASAERRGLSGRVRTVSGAEVGV